VTTTAPRTGASGRRGRWESLWQRIGATGPPDPILAELEAAYAAPGRHYHGLGHLDRLLEEYDALRHLADNPDAVELALWLHDVVWSPEGTDCEGASAAWARERLARSGVPLQLLDRVDELILATRHAPEPPSTPDEALVRDLDLITFAAPRDIFERCNALVRQEYAHVPDAAWREGRARVLRGFLDRPVIFHSAALRELEPRARDNLGRAVARLDIPYT